MTQNLTTRVSNILVSVEARAALGNKADAAYAKATGGKYTPFTTADVGPVANNAIVPKAVLNASLCIAALRGDNSDEGRLNALHSIAYGTLSDVELTIVRTQANTGWDARSLSRDLGRLTSNPNHVDFLALNEQTKKLDDVVAQAVAQGILDILQS